MTLQNEKLNELFELANHYPSPHNGQPIRVKIVDSNSLELYFEKQRGLQAAEVSHLFSFVTMGVFIYHLSLCAKALGHDFSYELKLPALDAIKGEGNALFATCQLEYSKNPADNNLLTMINFRQTSRKKYSEGINEKLSDQTIDIATKSNLQLYKMNRADGHQAIWLNQRAVFDDMFDDAVRQELNHWLRYSKQEKEAKRDGLSYDCMELNGRAMKFLVNHYRILRMKGIAGILKRYYLRTMSDDSDVYYLLTPFSTEKEAFDVGVAVMQIWQEIAAEGYYLHPFGTIMSNLAAHNDFLELVNVKEDIHKNFLVFIYRCGRSKPPNRSLRIPLSEHLLMS